MIPEGMTTTEQVKTAFADRKPPFDGDMVPLADGTQVARSEVLEVMHSTDDA
jgi:hypothetical protein